MLVFVLFPGESGYGGRVERILGGLMGKVGSGDYESGPVDRHRRLEFNFIQIHCLRCVGRNTHSIPVGVGPA